MTATVIAVKRLTLFITLGCCAPSSGDPPVPSTGRVEVPSEGLKADLEASQSFFAGRPTYETPLATGLEQVPGVDGLSAAACGECHTAAYEEWRVSTHAMAWVDLQFQAEIGKSDNSWLCQNCHTPLMVQHERWPRGLVDGDVERPIVSPNPVFDADLQQEGITCAACHVRDGVVHGPGVATDSPHPVAADPTFRTEAICLRCHQAVASYAGKNFVCTFETGAEWAASPYAAEGRTCLDCHMPPVTRAVAVEGPVREARRHWWRGAGIPKVDGVVPPVEANPPGVDVRAKRDGADLAVAITNARAGHMLPTGDPERWVQVDVQFLGADGEAVGEPWQHRMGQVWEWEPPRKLSDNRLGPRQTRELRVGVPSGATIAEVVVSSHRMKPDVAEYHDLAGVYPLSVETDRFEVPVAER